MSAECACGSTGADVVGLGRFLHCFAFGLHVWPAGGGLSLEQVESPAGAALTSGGTTAAPQLDELGVSSHRTCAGHALKGTFGRLPAAPPLDELGYPCAGDALRGGASPL